MYVKRDCIDSQIGHWCLFRRKLAGKDKTMDIYARVC